METVKPKVKPAVKPAVKPQPKKAVEKVKKTDDEMLLDKVAAFAAKMKRSASPVHFTTWKKLQVAANAAAHLLKEPKNNV